MQLLFLIFLLFILLLVTIYFFFEAVSRTNILLFSDAPYVPSKKKEIAEVLRFAGVSENDIFYDLGSGGGRVLAIALKDFNVKQAVGYELDAVQVIKTMLRLRLMGIPSDRFKVVKRNLLNAEVYDATIVYLYLHPKIMGKIVTELYKKFPSGCRVVSYRFSLPDIHPSEVLEQKGLHKAYLYKIS